MTTPVRLLPVLAQRRGRATSRTTCKVFTFREPGGDRGAGAAAARAAGRRARPSGRWPASVTTLVHGAEATRSGSRRPAAALFGSGDLDAPGRGTLRRRPGRAADGAGCLGRAPGRRPPGRHRAGRRASRPPGAPSPRAGAYVNNVEGDRRRGRHGRHRRPAARPLAGAAPRAQVAGGGRELTVGRCGPAERHAQPRLADRRRPRRAPSRHRSARWLVRTESPASTSQVDRRRDLTRAAGLPNVLIVSPTGRNGHHEWPVPPGGLPAEAGDQVARSGACRSRGRRPGRKQSTAVERI